MTFRLFSPTIRAVKPVTARDRGRINTPVSRPTSWWLAALRKRAQTLYAEHPDLGQPVPFESEDERRACIAFFNAAFRAEESGFSQARSLAGEVRAWDPELAECLELYGNEERWHGELVERFLAHVGGTVRPMGRVTGTFYKLYARATEMESIMLTNLMFETIGSTTYRLALGRLRTPAVRAMLTVLARDESFHVPLNVHFIREILAHKHQSPLARAKLTGLYHVLFVALLGSSAASREVAQAFDKISWRELATAYAENLGRLFLREPDLRFEPPWLLLRAFGLTRLQLERSDDDATSLAAAEAAVERSAVQVTAL